MAQETPAYVISAEAHSAALFRQTLQTLISGSGVVGAGDYQVTQNGTPNLSVNVAAGMIWIPGTQGSTTGMQVNTGSQYATYGSPLSADFQSQGCYIGYNDGTTNLTIASNLSGNPRIDCVVAQVQDAFYSGSSNQVVLAVLEGTAASSPSPPTIQNNCVVLAQVAVASGASSITNSNITDKRPFAAAGLQIPGRLLGKVIYAPGSNTQIAIPTSFGAISSSNLTVSFTAPASGAVTVRLQGWYQVTASSGNGYVNVGVIAHGGSQLGYSYQAVNTASTGAVEFAGQVSTDVEVTGLTAGSGYQLDWAAGVPSGGSTAAVWADAVTGINAAGGPATMKVYAA